VAQRSEIAHGLNGQRVKIRAPSVSFYYGRFRALHDVSRTIAEHKITAMIGASGCGKSTLLQIFNRMYDLTPGTWVKGSVKIGGEEITTTNRLQELRRRIGMVFQRAIRSRCRSTTTSRTGRD
jgi:phosphate transport system ATP-binding protein